MKKKKDWIICYSGKWSDNYIYGIGNLILEYNKKNKNILWVNSPNIRNVSFKRIGNRKIFIKLFTKRLMSVFLFLKKKSPSFFILNPIFLPYTENENIEKINFILIRLQIKFVLYFLQIQNADLFCTSPIDAYKIFDISKIRIYIHYFADKYTDYREASKVIKEKMNKIEKSIIERANIVMCSSKQIKQKLNDKYNIVVEYLPHGVDFAHFQKYENTYLDFTRYKRPIIGYFGSLTNANDKDVLVKIAECGFTMMLVGEVKGDYENLKKYDNIIFTGPIEYSCIPSYARYFDVGIMAWIQSDWIKNSNPKKTYEYLALGLPIVSTYIPELKKLEKFIYFADTPLEFIMKIEHALQENNNEKIRDRKEEAKNNDWSKRLEYLENVKLNYLKKQYEK